MAVPLMLCGCASASSDIAPAYVSSIPYQNYTCEQLSAEAQQVSTQIRPNPLGDVIDSQFTNAGNWANKPGDGAVKIIECFKLLNRRSRGL
jgi:hypothetical protein